MVNPGKSATRKAPKRRRIPRARARRSSRPAASCWQGRSRRAHRDPGRPAGRVNRGTAYQHFQTANNHRGDHRVGSQKLWPRGCSAIPRPAANRDNQRNRPAGRHRPSDRFLDGKPRTGPRLAVRAAALEPPASDPFWKLYQIQVRPVRRSELAQPGIDTESCAVTGARRRVSVARVGARARTQPRTASEDGEALLRRSAAASACTAPCARKNSSNSTRSCPGPRPRPNAAGSRGGSRGRRSAASSPAPEAGDDARPAKVLRVANPGPCNNATLYPQGHGRAAPHLSAIEPQPPHRHSPTTAAKVLRCCIPRPVQQRTLLRRRPVYTLTAMTTLRTSDGPARCR